MKTNWKNPLLFVAAAWSVISPVFVVLCNFIAFKAKTSSDFMVSFYVAGLLVLQGKGSQIYPGADCAGWKDAPFNNLVHQIVPGLPLELTANFMYCPAVAVLMSPWALFPPALALTAWQIFNIALLVLSAALLSRCLKGGSAFACFVLFMAFAPVFATLWVGQTSIILGLAPLSAACFFLKRKAALAAGLLLSLLALKPQYIGFCLAALLLMPSAKKTAAGFLLGISGLSLISSCVLSWSAFNNWLYSLRLSEQFMGGQGYTMPAYLAASLPAAVLLTLPQQVRSSVHFIVYATAALAAVGLLVFVWRRGAKLSLPQSQNSVRLTLALVAAGLAEVLCAPRLVLYDASLLVPALSFIWFDPDLAPRLKLIVLVAIAAVDLYTFLCLLLYPNPLFLVAILSAAGIAALAFLFKACQADDNAQAEKQHG
jgi:hypothetical protein